MEKQVKQLSRQQEPAAKTTSVKENERKHLHLVAFEEGYLLELQERARVHRRHYPRGGYQGF